MFIVVISVGLYLDRNLLFLIIGGPARFQLFKKKKLNKDQTFLKDKLPPRWLNLMKYYKLVMTILPFIRISASPVIRPGVRGH